jgi:hypothetical protein
LRRGSVRSSRGSHDARQHSAVLGAASRADVRKTGRQTCSGSVDMCRVALHRYVGALAKVLSVLGPKVRECASHVAVLKEECRELAGLASRREAEPHERCGICIGGVGEKRRGAWAGLG